MWELVPLIEFLASRHYVAFKLMDFQLTLQHSLKNIFKDIVFKVHLENWNSVPGTFKMTLKITFNTCDKNGFKN